MTEYIITNKKKPAAERGLVFVVDDDPVMRSALTMYLSEKGFKVRAIADGIDALLALEREAPRLIVSDIRMEKCDGLTLLRGLQNRAETRGIPVIFISAFADDEMMNQARELGASHFFIKPFPLASLHQHIVTLLGAG
jgi:two-component system, OmpR family, phosphate regulon response regulator PhoB